MISYDSIAWYCMLLRCWLRLAGCVSQDALSCNHLENSWNQQQIYWDENLTKLFEESKGVIIRSIEDGIKSFEIDQWTCLMTDFSKTGIGYLLTQKRCSCEEINPYSCPGGWQVVLAGTQIYQRRRVSICSRRGWGVGCTMGFREYQTLYAGESEADSNHGPQTPR